MYFLMEKLKIQKLDLREIEEKQKNPKTYLKIEEKQKNPKKHIQKQKRNRKIQNIFRNFNIILGIDKMFRK